MRSSDRDSICGRDDRPFSMGVAGSPHGVNGEALWGSGKTAFRYPIVCKMAKNACAKEAIQAGIG